MKIKIERRTTVVTSYELDLSTLNIVEFKQALEDCDSEWISEQFETSDELSELIMNNSDMASELFNVINSYAYGVKEEYFLDDEEYSINH
jgi:hypothetical protein